MRERGSKKGGKKSRRDFLRYSKFIEPEKKEKKKKMKRKRKTL